MPRSNVAAAASVQGEKPNATSSQPEQASTPFETASIDILRAAGVPEEAVKAYESSAAPAEPPAQPEPAKQESPSEQPVPEEDAGSSEEPSATKAEETVAEPEPETPTEPEETESPGEEDATEQTAEEPEGEAQPTWYQKRLGKWKRKEQRLQDEIDDLKDRLTRKPETQSAQAGPGPETLADLQRTVEINRAVRDWCIKHQESGAVLNEGTPQERVVTPDEVRDKLIESTHFLEDVPRRWHEIQQRDQLRQIAQTEWPDLYNPATEVYKTAQEFLQAYPVIAQNPNRDLILGLMVEGWKPFQARIQARLKGQQAAANGSKLPAALTRKIPPIPKTPAPNPPRGSRVPSPIKDAAAAVNRIAQEGATPENVHAAIAAIEAQNAVSGGTKRTPAPV
jgi:hypothetical protein